MLTDAQITTAATLLENNKLKPRDVVSMVQNFRILVGHLETTYNYKFSDDLQALDDSDGSDKAAIVRACLTLLISKQFNVTFITEKTGIKLSNTDKRRLITLYAFNVLYATPPELSELAIILIGGVGGGSNGITSSVGLTRVW